MYNSKYYNKEKQMESNKKWREKNFEKYKEYKRTTNKKYRENHKDKMNTNALNYYYRHKEEVLRKLKEKRDKKIGKI